MRLAAAALIIGLTCLGAASAQAQVDRGVIATAEIASEERRRGLGWSDGAPVFRATASIPLAPGVSLDGTVVTLRGSHRHGGADAVVDLGATYVTQAGAWRLTTEGRYHLFPGASGRGYGEIGANGGVSLGPASIDLFGSYAPRQRSIGGDNLYMAFSTAVVAPGTPFTLSGHIGRSSGKTHNPSRSARLRPGGTYWDHGVSIDYQRSRWFAGLRYANSDIGTPSVPHVRASLIARVGLTL